MKKHEKVLNNKKEEDTNEADDILDLSDLGDLREKEVLPQFTFVRADEGEGLDEVLHYLLCLGGGTFVSPYFLKKKFYGFCVLF